MVVPIIAPTGVERSFECGEIIVSKTDLKVSLRTPTIFFFASRVTSRQESQVKITTSFGIAICPGAYFSCCGTPSGPVKRSLPTSSISRGMVISPISVARNVGLLQGYRYGSFAAMLGREDQRECQECRTRNVRGFEDVPGHVAGFGRDQRICREDVGGGQRTISVVGRIAPGRRPVLEQCS